MADTKISAMPAVAVLMNADDFPCLQIGVNKKVTRQLILTAGMGQLIELVNSAGQSAKIRAVSGNAQIEVKDAGAIDIKGTGIVGMYDNAITYGVMVQPGGFVVNTFGAAGGTWSAARAGGPSMTLGGAFGTLVVVAAGGCVLPYIDGSGGAWGGPGAPADYNTAIDRIANWLFLNSGLIP